MYSQRREVPLGLLSWGRSPYAAYAPDGTAAAYKPDGGGSMGSGLDNGPTVVEGIPFNLTGLDLQDQYDAGYTGLYLMDTKAQIGIAELLGRTEQVEELKRRFKTVSTVMMTTLWNESLGLFQNALSTPFQPIARLAPTHFYPLLAGPEMGGPNESVASTTVRRGLTNNSRMAVWPSGDPPATLPPVYARPIVQWYAKICDAKGDGCVHGPHVICCQLECNFRYAAISPMHQSHATSMFYVPFSFNTPGGLVH